MDIIIRNTGETPIYDQITQQVKSLILTGTLEEGEMLPLHAGVGQGSADLSHHHQTGL